MSNEQFLLREDPKPLALIYGERRPVREPLVLPSCLVEHGVEVTTEATLHRERVGGISVKGYRLGEILFDSTLEQSPTTSASDAAQLAECGSVVARVAEDVAAEHSVESFVWKFQPRDVHPAHREGEMQVDAQVAIAVDPRERRLQTALGGDVQDGLCAPEQVGFSFEPEPDCPVSLQRPAGRATRSGPTVVFGKTAERMATTGAANRVTAERYGSDIFEETHRPMMQPCWTRDNYPIGRTV